jgi:hypothetical protein
MQTTHYFEKNEVKVTYAGNQFGYFDKLIVCGSDAHLIDYKFARLPYEADSPQFWAYCWGVWDMFQSIETITVHVLLPFQNTIDVEVFTRKEHYEKFVTEIMAIVANAERDAEEERRPGDPCQFCARPAECSKLLAIGKTVAKKIGYQELVIPENLIPENITSPELISQAKRIGKVLRKWAAGVDYRALELARNGEQIPGYRLKERKAKFTVTDAQVAFSVLSEQGVTAEEFAAACKVAIGGIDKIVKDKSPRGKKSTNVQVVRDRLVECGAARDEGMVEYLAAEQGFEDIDEENSENFLENGD